MLKNMDPPLGFGSKCPDRLAFKKLIRLYFPIKILSFLRKEVDDRLGHVTM